MRIIAPEDCKKATGYDEYDLLSLTGVFGIHTPNEFNSLASKTQIRFRMYYDENDILNVEISDSPAISMLRIHINVPLKKEIYIDLFRLQQAFKGANAGYRRLSSQIHAARRLGFNRISLWAYGDINSFPKWDGYMIWGKYGFSMFEKDEIDRFNQLMREDRLEHCRTIDSLVESKEGTAYWKHRGNDWHGEFILKSNSHNMKVFKEYGLERRLF